ncbi:hypothetical protein QR685DRAFT_303977 [Neurospora intermedia]|uniref:Uncharacterized protein n=1 Tax=Neurospora intermedia TaxID=5142 RepID=A0ABR3DB33_NEUIN
MADKKKKNNNNSHDKLNFDESQSAMTTTSTANGTTANETTTNTTNGSKTSSNPMSTLHAAARKFPATEIPSSIIQSLINPTPTTTHQQPSLPRIISATSSDIRRRISQFGNDLRVLGQVFGEDRHGSLQTAERFRQVYAMFHEVAQGVLSELDEFDRLNGIVESEGVGEIGNGREIGNQNGDEEEKNNGMGEREPNGETRNGT